MLFLRYYFTVLTPACVVCHQDVREFQHLYSVCSTFEFRRGVPTSSCSTNGRRSWTNKTSKGPLCLLLELSFRENRVRHNRFHHEHGCMGKRMSARFMSWLTVSRRLVVLWLSILQLPVFSNVWNSTCSYLPECCYVRQGSYRTRYTFQPYYLCATAVAQLMRGYTI